MGVGIIFNEIVINKTVFRMVLLLVMDVRYFILSGAIIFLSLARAKLEMAKRNFPSY